MRVIEKEHKHSEKRDQPSKSKAQVKMVTASDTSEGASLKELQGPFRNFSVQMEVMHQQIAG